MTHSCLAKRFFNTYTCTVCNYTWDVSETRPVCRSKYYGEQKLREIRELLSDSTTVKRGDNRTSITAVSNG